MFNFNYVIGRKYRFSVAVNPGNAVRKLRNAGSRRSQERALPGCNSAMVANHQSPNGAVLCSLSCLIHVPPLLDFSTLFTTHPFCFVNVFGNAFPFTFYATLKPPVWWERLLYVHHYNRCHVLLGFLNASSIWIFFEIYSILQK